MGALSAVLPRIKTKRKRRKPPGFWFWFYLFWCSYTIFWTIYGLLRFPDTTWMVVTSIQIAFFWFYYHRFKIEWNKWKDGED